MNPQFLTKRGFQRRTPVVDMGVRAVSCSPALCQGCSHRGFFYTMSKGKDYVVSGDIGCYTLGAAAALNAIDTCVCMVGCPARALRVGQCQIDTT